MYKKLLSLTVIVCFFLTTIAPYAHANTVLGLPAPGTMVNLSPAYVPVIVKGVRVHPENPILFDFIVDTGNSGLTANNPQLKIESQKLIKYFLASLTIPEDDVWVNLSPYEKNRIIPDQLGQTEMGRDMLAEDYILKQLTASLIYPEKALGKEFWNKIYTKSQQLYGTNAIPVNTFNKVWIVADKAKVYVHSNTAFVVASHLKVMLEEDYLAMQKHVSSTHDTHAVASKIVRAIVLPELEKEVNQGQNFSNLRQIFHSMILAAWYKKNLKEALLNQVYADKSKMDGVIASQAKQSREQIYAQYLQAYKKGVFNYIKEDIQNGQTVPRKYFSGGVLGRVKVEEVGPQDTDAAILFQHPVDGAMVAVNALMTQAQNQGPDAAMVTLTETTDKGIAIAARDGDRVRLFLKYGKLSFDRSDLKFVNVEKIFYANGILAVLKMTDYQPHVLFLNLENKYKLLQMTAEVIFKALGVSMPSGLVPDQKIFELTNLIWGITVTGMDELTADFAGQQGPVKINLRTLADAAMTAGSMEVSDETREAWGKVQKVLTDQPANRLELIEGLLHTFGFASVVSVVDGRDGTGDHPVIVDIDGYYTDPSPEQLSALKTSGSNQKIYTVKLQLNGKRTAFLAVAGRTTTADRAMAVPIYFPLIPNDSGVEVTISNKETQEKVNLSVNHNYQLIVSRELSGKAHITVLKPTNSYLVSLDGRNNALEIVWTGRHVYLRRKNDAVSVSTKVFLQKSTKAAAAMPIDVQPQALSKDAPIGFPLMTGVLGVKLAISIDNKASKSPQEDIYLSQVDHHLMVSQRLSRWTNTTVVNPNDSYMVSFDRPAVKIFWDGKDVSVQNVYPDADTIAVKRSVFLPLDIDLKQQASVSVGGETKTVDFDQSLFIVKERKSQIGRYQFVLSADDAKDGDRYAQMVAQTDSKEPITDQLTVRLVDAAMTGDTQETLNKIYYWSLGGSILGFTGGLASLVMSLHNYPNSSQWALTLVTAGVAVSAAGLGLTGAALNSGIILGTNKRIKNAAERIKTTSDFRYAAHRYAISGGPANLEYVLLYLSNLTDILKKQSYDEFEAEAYIMAQLQDELKSRHPALESKVQQEVRRFYVVLMTTALLKQDLLEASVIPGKAPFLVRNQNWHVMQLINNRNRRMVLPLTNLKEEVRLSPFKTQVDSIMTGFTEAMEKKGFTVEYSSRENTLSWKNIYDTQRLIQTMQAWAANLDKKDRDAAMTVLDTLTLEKVQAVLKDPRIKLMLHMDLHNGFVKSFGPNRDVLVQKGIIKSDDKLLTIVDAKGQHMATAKELSDLKADEDQIPFTVTLKVDDQRITFIAVLPRWGTAEDIVREALLAAVSEWSKAAVNDQKYWRNEIARRAQTFINLGGVLTSDLKDLIGGSIEPSSKSSKVEFYQNGSAMDITVMDGNKTYNVKNPYSHSASLRGLIVFLLWKWYIHKTDADSVIAQHIVLLSQRDLVKLSVVAAHLSVRDADVTDITPDTAVKDNAALAKTPEGGIDLNARNLQMDVQGDNIDIKFDPAMIAQFKRGDFSGVSPVIITITPIANIMPLLGQ